KFGRANAENQGRGRRSRTQRLSPGGGGAGLRRVLPEFPGGLVPCARGPRGSPTCVDSLNMEGHGFPFAPREGMIAPENENRCGRPALEATPQREREPGKVPEEKSAHCSACGKRLFIIA